MRRSFVIGLILTALLVGTSGAAVQSLPLQAERTALDLVEARDAALRFDVSIAELQALDVTTQAGQFTRISIPGFHNSMVDGAPELPMMNRLIEVPFGARVSVEVLSASRRVVRLGDHGITTPLMPHQPSLSKSADPATVPFVYDRGAYDAASEPELVRVVDLGHLRSRHLARLEISPVSYDPATGELVVTDELELAVNFDGVDRAGEAEMLASTWSPFFEPVFENVAGSRANHLDYPDLVKNPVKMVIVTPAEFQYALTDFVNWKTERGFDVILAVMGTPEVGSTTASIQTYLHDLYNAATPEDPAPSFVLFVGDVAQCPTFSESGDATDRPYCAVDGDLYPEMYYGRFSATNLAQLQSQLDKTMMYDQYTMPDPSYLGNVVMTAGVDAGYAPTHGNGQINYGTEHYFNAAHGINSYTYLYPASDAAGAPAEIVAHASDGIGFMNYTAHGSQTSWADPSFTQSNINSLTNYGKYFLAIGNCCLTSSYDYGECFGETFLRADGKGAVGYIGGSNSTYWDEDYWWGVGYHPSGEIDGSAYPVADTGIGAYDGVFHENGEASAQWYVTNDAIVFCGNMTVTEAGSSRETYYWNIYNLLGDPSLSTYMGVPAANPVTHQQLFTNSPELVVDAAVGSYVGLTQGGVIFAQGSVGYGGRVSLPIDGILAPGTAKLVVTAQNHEPFVQDVPVIVPAVVMIDPMVIDANVATDVTVTVYEEDGVTPVVGLDVWADGLGYATTPVQTDASGVAVINVDYPYGPTIDIVGKNAADPYELFREPITVNAAALTSPDLTVSTSIGLSDAFPLNLPATLHATVSEPGHTLFALMPDGSELSTSSLTLDATATDEGVVTGIIAVSGYDLYTEDFDVVEAFGQLTGTVTAGASDAAGAVVRLYDTGGVELMTATCDGAGAYDFGEDILVDDYVLVVDIFGYLHYEAPFFLNYGANVQDVAMTAAPSGVLTGYLEDAVTGDPIENGVVKIYRSDNNELYTEAVTDATGLYQSISLPYFTYTVIVRAYQHVPVTISIEIDDAVVEKSFVMDQTNGDLLIVDDGGARDKAAKYDEKGNLLASAYVFSGAKSADIMAADLELMGFGVTLEDIGTTDPATWAAYDVVIVSCGDNTTTLENSAVRTAMLNHVDGGGKLLLEGGEVGYDWYTSGAFAERVLHSTDWNHDASGNFVVADPSHYVMSVPNSVPSDVAVTYNGYGDQDAMVPLADAQMIGTWGDYPTDASVIAYDPNPAPQGGQIVYFGFNYTSLGTGCADVLLENAVHWLLALEIGSSSVSGQALLMGESDHGGILIEAVPGGQSTYTAADGTYTLNGLFEGDYTIRASKDGWGIQVMPITLAEGENMTGVDFVLSPVAIHEVCNQPALAIPDNTPAGVSDVINVELDPSDLTTVSSVEVFVDITHTWQGDLYVDLTSPTGTTVRLHNRTGSSADDIYGWYPAELEPAESLDAFAGEGTDGDWTLWVSDNAGADTGTLNEWCLKITYTGVIPNEADPGEGDGVPSVYALDGNFPNPFNPMTTVKFSLPRPGKTRLAVYDLQGRLVRVLADEHMTAAVHTVVWNGQDDSGRPMPSGAYYLRMSSEEFSAVRKMTLLK